MLVLPSLWLAMQQSDEQSPHIESKRRDTNFEEENMKSILILGFLLFLPISLLSQAKTEQDIDYAYQNAKKGIYWALTNIPDKKTKIETELIADDRLYAEVKLSKEFNGVKIISTGYYYSNEVTITIYKSYDSLREEGYVKIEPAVE